MTPTLRTALLGALIGSVAVAATLALLVLVGQIPKAPYVASWQAVVGGGWAGAAVLGGAAFLLIGTLWGLPFAWVPNPTVGKGMLLGILPTLWALIGWPLVLGNPVLAGGDLFGLIVPVVMNVGIWGSLLGWYARRHTPAATV